MSYQKKAEVAKIDEGMVRSKINSVNLMTEPVAYQQGGMAEWCEAKLTALI